MRLTGKRQNLSGRYTAAQVVRITKISSTFMLDYLHRMKIVSPQLAPTPGKGKRRHYSFSDLVVLRFVARLLEQGLSVKKLKASLAELRRQVPLLDGDASATLYLVTDGTSAFWQKSANEIIDLTNSGQLTFAFILNVRQIHSEVVSEIVAMTDKAA
jgi:DNA-binding transcriptional MerR regulator